MNKPEILDRVNSAESGQGMKRFHARNEVVKQLKEKSLFVGVEDNAMTIPICAYDTFSVVSRGS